MSRRNGSKNSGNAQAVAALLCCVSVAVAAVALACFSPSAALRGPGSGRSLVPASDQIAGATRRSSQAEERGSAAAQFRAARLAALPETEITLIAVGDIMLSRTVAERMARKGNDYPFRKMSSFLDSADVTFGNLETPIIAGSPVVSGEISFRADPGVERELAVSGFDILSLANNHTPNRGERGIERTAEALEAAGIAHAGVGVAGKIGPAVVEAKGVRFAFLAYTDPTIVPASYGPAADRFGTAFLDLDALKSDVAAAQEAADVVIVSMHAGAEYLESPGGRQVEFARAAIDAGADLVIGHHPHVVQPIEEYRGGLIFYSLGNFIFDQDWSRETRDGLAVRFVFHGANLARAELYPVSIDESQPRFASGGDADRVLARLGTMPADIDALVWDAASQSPRPYSIKAVAVQDTRAGRAAPLVPARSSSGRAGEDGFSLEGGRLRLLFGGTEVWQAPDEAWVDSWWLVDMDGDGFDELAVSAWLPGQFGESKPFWVSEDSTLMTSRLLIYSMKGGLPEPRWFSSGLARPNCRIVFSDLDLDGSAELIAYEGDYADSPRCVERRVSVWRWNGWGFTNLWTGPDAESGPRGLSAVMPFGLP